MIVTMDGNSHTEQQLLLSVLLLRCIHLLPTNVQYAAFKGSENQGTELKLYASTEIWSFAKWPIGAFRSIPSYLGAQSTAAATFSNILVFPFSFHFLQATQNTHQIESNAI